MATDSSRFVPGYKLFRLIFASITGLVWFLLFWGFGYLVAAQLPGEGPLSFWTAWRFFLVGFLPVLFFGGPATFIGFLQQHLVGVFTPPALDGGVSPPLFWRAQQPNNPWMLGFNRLFLLWLPSVLLALLFLRLFFPDEIGRGSVALVLASLGAVLAGIVATCSSGKPFRHEIQLAPEQRAWQGSFFSYLFWRHGVPWGIGNGLISMIIPLAVFPRTPSGEYGVLPASAVGIDALVTGLLLCFFMAISAHPHAWVDTRLGVINAPDHARSPARSRRVFWFVSASLAIALGVIFLLKVLGVPEISIWWFVSWKGLISAVIAGASAMATAYWTLAREKAALALESLPQRLSEKSIFLS
jgi:hypothetical protein